LALEQHRVHRSLLRPPLFMGVERELFFTAAACGVPIIGYGSLSLRSLALLIVYVVVATFACRRLTAMDHHLLRLFLANLRYRDHYDPLASPDLAGPRPATRKG
jgi:type IV secretory pathway TrbD component